MKKILIALSIYIATCAVLVLLSSSIKTRSIYDKIYQETNYNSYYNNRFKNPVLVTYNLRKGGGNVQRTGMRFVGNPYTANDHDYASSGYDKGHLCNAEDFAYNKELLHNTFTYYNCVPQTPNLNRGCWKSLETKIRKLSQNEELYIATGAFFNENNKRIGNRLYVPDTCFKVVKIIRTNKIVYSMIFINNIKASSQDYDPKKIEDRIKIKFLNNSFNK